MIYRNKMNLFVFKERQDVSDTSWTLNQEPGIRQTPNGKDIVNF